MTQVKNKYYSLVKNENEATITIYGDITSWPWMDSDVSAYNLSKQLDDLKDVASIKVFINSYGGEVAEGLAIYNALKRHSAKVTTICDGFACSIASVIFMAGDERIMNNASLLMIHNAWTCVVGNADEIRKAAEDLDKINSASIAAYKAVASIDEDKIKELMDNETWITPEEAMEYGFATSIEGTSEDDKPNQSVRQKIYECLTQRQDSNNNKPSQGPPQDPSKPQEEQKTNNEREKCNDKVIAFFNALSK